MFEGSKHVLLFLGSPQIVFQQFWKKYIGAEAMEQWTTGGSTKRTGNLSSAFEKADSQCELTFKCRLESWELTPKNIISPRMFYLK